MLQLVFAMLTQDRASMISQINSNNTILWKATSYARFEGQPVGATKAMCGVDMPSYLNDLSEKIERGEIHVNSGALRAEDLPESFDATSNPAWAGCSEVISEIRDQSACGCCWAFGAAEAASDRMCIATNGKVAVPLSAQDMCFCGSRSGCSGGFPTTAWALIEAHGLVTGSQNKGIGPFGKDGFCSAFSLPHCHHYGNSTDPYPAEGSSACPRVTKSPQCPTKCDAGAKAPHADFASDKYSYKGKLEHYPTEKALMSTIMTSGPVETAFQVYADFENYASGIYHKTSRHSLGGHAVKMVGWGVEGGVKYWKVGSHPAPSSNLILTSAARLSVGPFPDFRPQTARTLHTQTAQSQTHPRHPTGGKQLEPILGREGLLSHRPWTERV